MNSEDFDVNCISDSIDDTEDNSDVVSRQWKIKINRRYTGRRAGSEDVSWNLTATYGIEPTAKIVSTNKMAILILMARAKQR